MVNIRVIGVLCFPSRRKILLHLNRLPVHLSTLAQVLFSVGFDTEVQKVLKKPR